MKAEINFTIIYIIGAVIYFIWKNLIKPNQKKAPSTPEIPLPDIFEQKKPEEKRIEREVIKPFSYDDRHEKEAVKPFSYEERHEKEAHTNKTHHIVEKTNFNDISYETSGIKNKNYEVEMSRFDEYDINDEQFAEEWALKEKMRYPEGMREAFVLSEIFNKKY